MRVWRITRERNAADPLSGRGGLIASGRWHFKGSRVVYASESLALAALELLVHLDRDLTPSDLVQLEIEIPHALEVESIVQEQLPPDWRVYPAPCALQELGSRWIRQGRSAVLKVPSAVIPEESNFLLNPEHRAAKRIKIAGRRRFSLDERLRS